MLKIKSYPYNSVCVWADSQEELGKTFMRFQEHYESSNPEFRGKIFTVGQLKHWYSIKYGADTYHSDWVGFNFPSRVLIPFKHGLFDPLTPEENQLLSFFKYRNDDFYIIGANDNKVLRHELSHSLYTFNTKYRNEIDNFIKKNKKSLQKVYDYILDKGYCKEVLYDEIQAYITDNEDEYIINNTSQQTINEINKIYNKYWKGIK